MAKLSNMAPSTPPLYASVYLFLSTFLTFFSVVDCHQSNIGFRSAINVKDVRITSDYQRPYTTNFSVAARPIPVNYQFTVPVTITRDTSTLEFVSYAILLSSYDDEDSGGEAGASKVYSTQLDMDGQNSILDVAQFNLSLRTTNVTRNFYIRAKLGSSGRGFNPAQGSVLTLSNTTQGFTIMEQSEFDDIENIATHAILAEEVSRAPDPAIDTSSETVIPGGDKTDDSVPKPPVNPVDPSKDSEKKPQDPDNKTPGGIPPTPVVDKPPGTPPPTPIDDQKQTPGGITPAPAVQPPGTSGNNCPNLPAAPVQTVTVTTCAARPTPRACRPRPGSPARKPPPSTQSKRQSANVKTTFAINLSYKSSKGVRPVRLLPIEGVGIVTNNNNKKLNDRTVHAKGLTTMSGDVKLVFALNAGESMRLLKIYMSFDTANYRISTSKDAKNFLYYRRYSVQLPPDYINAGSSKSFSKGAWNDPTNRLLEVHDRFLNSHLFTKRNIPFVLYEKLQNIWYPAPAKLGNGMVIATAMHEVNGPYLSIEDEYAVAGGPISHEYGHWIHYLARAKKYFDGGGDHSFCDPAVNGSKGLAFQEGYATAYGLASLSGSGLEDFDGTGYCWDGVKSTCVEIEKYDCSAKLDLLTEEGRVAATMLDLWDSLPDSSGGSPSVGDPKYSDYVSLTARQVFFDPIYGNQGNNFVTLNPPDIKDYWKYLKNTIPKNQVDAAWNVFLYQYAKFDK